ncbi:hypothetical protein [Listeria seeligeri]|uniref:hypothetical protein n=1 Tax=Listeria seeligeri TaxID=1640 RepID=UPI0022EA5DB8|nr:hypothetical protein [Listeria seeligeri]
MKQFIVMCIDIKDVWNEVDHITESKSKYVTHVDNKNAIVTLGNEQYIYRVFWITLSDYNSVDGWMLSDSLKLSRRSTQLLGMKTKKLTALYQGGVSHGETT